MSDLTGLGSVFDLASNIINKIFPDKTQAAAALAQLEMAKLQGALAEEQNAWDAMKAQIEVNKTEASSSSIFVAGWRPFIGWGCGFAFLYSALVQPMAVFICGAIGHPVPTPTVDSTLMMQVLFAMLGIGAMRTAEKIKGAQGNEPGH